MKPLLDEHALQRSPVVSNSLMNRERGGEGVNSYAKELCFSPLAFLKDRLTSHHHASWLDLGCGRGRALIETAESLAAEGRAGRLTLLGVDLVAMFDRYASDLHFLRLEQGSLADWWPDRDFDLITCVHGLHYIGDKLGLIARACRWLTARGVFLPHLDLNNVRLADGASAHRRLFADFRHSGLTYTPRRHLIESRGRRQVDLGYEFIGGDDNAGPNCTGQPAIDSYYRPQSFLNCPGQECTEMN